MIYHLYDNNRQHLAMSDSLEDLQNAALQAFLEDGLPFAFIRWSDTAGQQQERRITAANVTATTVPGTARPAAASAMPGYGAAQPARRRKPQRSARQRANFYTGVAILFLLLYMASEFVSILGR